MRVVHVSPTDIDGGASLGAYKLHRALISAGVDSRMLVVRKYGDDPTVVPRRTGAIAQLERLRVHLDRLPLHAYSARLDGWWSVGWLPFDIRKAIASLAPDVVQFHWAGGAAVPIRTIAQLREYPLVWTLRDMWPLTGGCHYSGDCDKFLTGCGTCPQLGSSSPLDISRWQWWRKHRAWRDVPVTYVALCNWMAAHARQSPLTHGNEVTVIPNGVDVERFRPIGRAAARAAWDLPADRPVILFGALNSVQDKRKGFAYLVEALRRLSAEGWGERALAVVFGASSSNIDIGLPVRYVGRLRDDVSLAALYSAADAMVVPSVQENAAKTALEALACGVPVVAFANTGQVDIVDHKVNGYLAENLSSADLARGIAWCLEQSMLGDGLSRRAREKALRRFDIRQVALSHLALYERLLAERPARLAAERGPAGLQAPLIPPGIGDALIRRRDGRVS